MRPPRTLRHPALAALALLAIYAVVIALGDARAFSGSDAGGRAATVKVMAETGSWVPDVGYWAAEHDPEGQHHPLVHTRRRGDRWIQATTLPMVYAAVPLWRLGGSGATLLLPVLGGLLAAHGARRLARALGSTSGWPAFWLVGAAAPVAFYVGDLWEHAPAVGLALLAVALAIEDGGWVKAAAAGVIAGAAASLRVEVLVYAGAFAVVVLLSRGERKKWLYRPARMIAGVVGAAVPLSIGAIAERRILATPTRPAGGIREERVAEQIVGAADPGELLHRTRDAVITSVGLFPSTQAGKVVAGALLSVALLALAWWALRGSPSPTVPVVGALVLALGLYAGRLGQGPGFVPGFLPATPVAAAGVLVLRDRRLGRTHVVAGAALLALPIVWAFQWRGQLAPQWGGRLVLLTGALLVVAGAVALERAGWRRPGAVALVALAIAVTAYGSIWHAQRTAAVARAVEQIEAAPSDVVVVSAIAHLGREAGSWYGDRPWLRADSTADLESAAAVARDAGAERIDVVEHPNRTGQAELVVAAGWREVSERTVIYIRSIPLTVRRFER